MQKTHKIKWNKLTILVVRVITNKYTGEFIFGMSKPCMHCIISLKYTYTNKIAWSKDDGKIVICKTSELYSDHIAHSNRI